MLGRSEKDRHARARRLLFAQCIRNLRVSLYLILVSFLFPLGQTLELASDSFPARSQRSIGETNARRRFP